MLATYSSHSRSRSPSRRCLTAAGRALRAVQGPRSRGAAAVHPTGPSPGELAAAPAAAFDALQVLLSGGCWAAELALASERLPPAHVEVAAGPAVVQGGDYFGPHRQPGRLPHSPRGCGPGAGQPARGRVAGAGGGGVRGAGGSSRSKGSPGRCGCWRPAGPERWPLGPFGAEERVRHVDHSDTVAARSPGSRGDALRS
jgi:hypothetical protein